MPQYRVDVVQTAAYSVFSVELHARDEAQACARAIRRVAEDRAGDGRFEHSGSAPGDVRSPYAVEVRETGTGSPDGTLRTLPFASGEIGAQFPEVAELLKAARRLSEIAHAKPLSLAASLREAGAAIADLDTALEGFQDHV